MTTLEKIREDIESEYNKFRNRSEVWDERANGIGTALEIIDRYAEEEPTNEVSEIEENIIKYMKKYPNHVGNTDFWEDAITETV